MAEFSEVMRQYRRMLETLKKGNGIPAYANDSCAYNYPEDFEKEVMAWAAEHPQPVYPTWAEWLEDRRLATRKTIYTTEYGPNTIHNRCEEATVLVGEAYKPIPADIAQKLGIEPKDG